MGDQRHAEPQTEGRASLAQRDRAGRTNPWERRIGYWVGVCFADSAWFSWLASWLACSSEI